MGISDGFGVDKGEETVISRVHDDITEIRKEY